MLYTKISQALSLITSAENQIGHLHDLTKGELTIGAGDIILCPILLSSINSILKLQLKWLTVPV